MNYEEIIQQITAFAVAGKLNGLEIDVPYNSVTLRMTNVRIDGDGNMRFDQFRRFPADEHWSETGTNFMLDEHVKDYLESVLEKIQGLVKRDKNLFQL